MDYCHLNSVAKTDVFPLPWVDNLSDQLSNYQYFTTPDLVAGYWQLFVDLKSHEKTVFVTQSGLFEFSVMPFRLKNVPMTLQRLTETALSGLIATWCLFGLSGRHRRYWQNFCWTSAYLEASICLVAWGKPSFKAIEVSLGQECHYEVEYLGFCVSSAGIIADPAKVKAVKEFPFLKMWSKYGLSWDWPLIIEGLYLHCMY